MGKYFLSRGMTLPEYFCAQSIPEPNSGCYLWLGPIVKTGYGVATWRGHRDLAHRLSWSYQNKQHIPEGMVICHKCDVRGCVNPDHLFLGTYRDNSRDMLSKGRHRPAVLLGELNPRSRLTEVDVINIRSDGRKLVEIAKSYKVTPGMIGHIKSRRAWRHLA